MLKEFLNLSIFIVAAPLQNDIYITAYSECSIWLWGKLFVAVTL